MRLQNGKLANLSWPPCVVARFLTISIIFKKQYSLDVKLYGANLLCNMSIDMDKYCLWLVLINTLLTSHILCVFLYFVVAGLPEYHRLNRANFSACWVNILKHQAARMDAWWVICTELYWLEKIKAILERFCYTSYSFDMVNIQRFVPDWVNNIVDIALNLLCYMPHMLHRLHSIIVSRERSRDELIPQF